MFSDYSGIKLEIKNRIKSRTHTNTWKLNNTLLNNQCIEKEIEREVRKSFKMNKKEDTTEQNITLLKQQCLEGI